MDVYLEIGSKRVFAAALDWPGWSRGGRDEAAALRALLAYGPRYALALRDSGLDFTPPTRDSALAVVERLPGSATTDFGAPEAIPDYDRRPSRDDDLARQGVILAACWRTLDGAIAGAAGLTLRKGPRGGGRELEDISRHVLGAERGYLGRLAWKAPGETDNLNEDMRITRQAIMDALLSAAENGLPERGPRGGVIWPARYFVRRVAWHALDHAWEIEDRAS